MCQTGRTAGGQHGGHMSGGRAGTPTRHMQDPLACDLYYLYRITTSVARGLYRGMLRLPEGYAGGKASAARKLCRERGNLEPNRYRNMGAKGGDHLPCKFGPTCWKIRHWMPI